jgi:hypothetical protein
MLGYAVSSQYAMARTNHVPPHLRPSKKLVSSFNVCLLKRYRTMTVNVPNMCQSCKRANNPSNSYCIYCGSILNPIFCSSCGTINPARLDRCLECGATMPDMNAIRWNPIVRVIQPTSAMIVHSDSRQQETEPDRSYLARLRAKLGQR